MLQLHTRMHAGVMPAEVKVRMRRQHGPHLKSGAFDQTSAIYALWTALMVLGVAKRAEVLALPYDSAHAFTEAWSRGVETFFLGTSRDDVERLLQSLDRHVQYRTALGAMRTLTAFTIGSLRQGDVVLLELQASRLADGGRWVLAVGLEELSPKSASSVIGVLCLDSEVAPPALMRFNARLEIAVPHRGATHVRYDSAMDAEQRMTIVSAIALQLASPRLPTFDEGTPR
jgi:hypothetical protein